MNENRRQTLELIQSEMEALLGKPDAGLSLHFANFLPDIYFYEEILS